MFAATTESGKLFQAEIILFIKENLRVSNCILLLMAYSSWALPCPPLIARSPDWLPSSMQMRGRYSVASNPPQLHVATQSPSNIKWLSLAACCEKGVQETYYKKGSELKDRLLSGSMENLLQWTRTLRTAGRLLCNPVASMQLIILMLYFNPIL